MCRGVLTYSRLSLSLSRQRVALLGLQLAMPCLPPLLLSGRRYVSRLFKDIDGVLSRSAVVYHPHPPFSHKEILALPAPEESKHPEPDSVSETVAEYVSISRLPLPKY